MRILGNGGVWIPTWKYVLLLEGGPMDESLPQLESRLRALRLGRMGQAYRHERAATSAKSR